MWDLEPLWRMLIAAGLVVPIGLERELRGKAAGLRTHVVVGTASAAFAFVSMLAAPDGDAGTDRTRIAAQVVSGIGFMGAGVIFASGGRVHGLTTAAALWAAAAVGVCVGLGSTGLAAALTLVILIVLWPLDWLNERVLSDVVRSERTFQVIASDLDGLVALQRTLGRHGVDVREFELEAFGDGAAVRLVLRCRAGEARALISDLRGVDELRFVTDQQLTDPE